MTRSCSRRVTLYIGAFIAVSYRIEPPKDLPAAIDVRIRAFGTCAFFMLTVILSIGPLARLDPWFRKLLFNRRHFGVLTFIIALAARLVHDRVVRGAGHLAEPARPN